MARPESPLPPDTSPPLRKLAEMLRKLREESDLSYRDMSAAANVSAASLSRAASGRQVPTPELLGAYLKACGVPEAEYDKWQSLRHDALVVQHMAVRPFTDDSLVAGWIFSGYLRELHTAAGSPSLRTIETMSGISRSTIQRVLSDRKDSHDKPVPAMHQTVKVAAALLEFLPRSQRRRGRFSDVHELVRRNTMRTRRYDATTSPAAPAPRSEQPRDRAETALLRLARRAEDLDHYLAVGVLRADEEFVRLLGELQDSIHEAQGVLQPGTSSTEASA
ncbi:helix-turn-helix domain-containing protein [Streptomyces acidicola]|uniref:helix-turn-helix domain-containing protein n=1 Tax=Streptomyces acidicola TaxID=2596892 RepID=UPI0037964BB9